MNGEQAGNIEYGEMQGMLVSIWTPDEPNPYGNPVIYDVGGVNEP